MSDIVSLTPTNVQFPEIILRVLGNNGRLSYKIKCLAFGLLLYLVGLFITTLTNTNHIYLSDYPWLIKNLVSGFTFYAIIRALHQINPTLLMVSYSLYNYNETKYIKFVENINKDKNAGLFYHIFTLVSSFIFSMLSIFMFIGPYWVQPTLSSRVFIINKSYYVIVQAILGYGIGVVLNRLFYYFKLMNKYFYQILTPESINLIVPKKGGFLHPIGELSLKFTIACTIPSVIIIYRVSTEYLKIGIDGIINIIQVKPVYILMVFTYLIILIIVFFYPIRRSHYILISAKEVAIHYVDDIINEIIQSNKRDELEKLRTLNDVITTRERINKTSTWPINPSLIFKITSILLFPFFSLIVSILLQIYLEITLSNF